MADALRPAAPRWWSEHPVPAQDFLLAALLHRRPLPAAWAARFGATDHHIDRLLSRSILRELPEGFAIAETLAGADSKALAPWSRRRKVHRILAQECRRHPDRLESAAEHFDAAGDPAQAAEALLAAAETHCSRHQHSAAKACFFRGLSLLPHDTPDTTVVIALKGLARCASLAQEPLTAANDLRCWVSVPPWSERTAVRAEATLVLAALLSREGRHVESARARRAAARDLGVLGRDQECAEAALAAATALAYTGQYSLAREAVDAAAHAADRVGQPALQAQARTLRGLILGMLGETSEGLAEIRDSLELALRHGLTGAAAEAYRLLGTVQEYASLYPDEQAAFASALAYCRKHDERHTAGVCLGCLAYSYLRSGNWRRSEETARRVLADRTIPLASRHVAQSVRGLLLAHRGEPRTAARHLHQSLDGCRHIGLLLMDFFNLLGLALIDEMQGQPSRAGARYRELIDFWRGTDDRHDAIPGLTAAVSHFAQHGQRDDAAAAAEALDRIASLTANPESAGAAHVGAAELALLDGDTRRAADGFQRALAAFEKRQLAIEPIQTRLRLADALRALGEHASAEEALRTARAGARRLGARPLLARAEAMLADSGVRPRLEVSSGPSAWELLSARQRDVARELAAGQTNKQIAAQLGVSVRTVDMHVAHIFARLDCRTRTEAAARVASAAAALPSSSASTGRPATAG